jgi:hypothetical protein
MESRLSSTGKAQDVMSPSCALVLHVRKVRNECFIDTGVHDVMKRSYAPVGAAYCTTSFQGHSEWSLAVKSCYTLQSAFHLQRRHPFGVTSSKVSTDLYLKLATEVQPISCPVEGSSLHPLGCCACKYNQGVKT